VAVSSGLSFPIVASIQKTERPLFENKGTFYFGY